MDQAKPAKLLVFPLGFLAVSQHPVEFDEDSKQFLVVGKTSEVHQEMVEQRSYPADHQRELPYEGVLVDVALDAVHVGDDAETKQPDEDQAGGIET